MKKVLIITLITTLFLLKPQVSQALEVQDPNKALKSQIMLQNLIIGLSLDDTQILAIKGEASRLKFLGESLKRDIAAKLSDQAQALKTLKEETAKDVPQVPKDLARQIHRNKISSLKIRREYTDAQEAATRKIKDLLNDSQIYTITTFKPCLVPPKGPGRVGQDASQGGPGTRLLEKLRKLPEKKFQARKNDIVNRLLERAALKHPKQVNEKTLATQRSRILAIAERARDLSDIEFQVYKNQEGEAIKSMIKPQRKEVDLDKRIAKFLLSPDIIPVLEEQLSKNN